MEDVVIRSGDGSCRACGDVHEQILSYDEKGGYVSMWVGCGERSHFESLTPEQAIEMLRCRHHRLYGDTGFMVENDRNAEAMLSSLSPPSSEAIDSLVAKFSRC